MEKYIFTNDWFDIAARKEWSKLIPRIAPKSILEIGSYEGASTCFLIDALAPQQALNIHCIDSWAGGEEHQSDGRFATDMQSVEARFKANVGLAIKRHKTSNVSVVVHKKRSDAALAALIAEGRTGYFDFAYIDGSHQAPDVLFDAVAVFQLLKVGGMMVFDDYLWVERDAQHMNPVQSPKIAIDAFTNIYCRKLRVRSAPLRQLFVEKIAD